MALPAYEQKEIYMSDRNNPQLTNNLDATDGVGSYQLTHLHVTTS